MELKCNLCKVKPSKNIFYPIKKEEIFNDRKISSYFEFCYVFKIKKRVLEL